mmetsp:Transcript_8163/g.17502  ORF Transcript_8163/g.17502 Transcript_8163/m.17502 type:complete len:300 (+) Transcript_8163:1153-2052(+)
MGIRAARGAATAGAADAGGGAGLPDLRWGAGPALRRGRPAGLFFAIRSGIRPFRGSRSGNKAVEGIRVCHVPECAECGCCRGGVSRCGGSRSVRGTWAPVSEAGGEEQGAARVRGAAGRSPSGNGTGRRRQVRESAAVRRRRRQGDNGRNVGTGDVSRRGGGGCRRGDGRRGGRFGRGPASHACSGGGAGPAGCLARGRCTTPAAAAAGLAGQCRRSAVAGPSCGGSNAACLGRGQHRAIRAASCCRRRNEAGPRRREWWRVQPQQRGQTTAACSRSAAGRCRGGLDPAGDAVDACRGW